MCITRVTRDDTQEEALTGHFFIDSISDRWWKGALILLVLLATSVASLAVGALNFSSKTKDPADFAPTKVLECFAAHRAFGDEFPTFLAHDAEAIYIHTEEGRSIMTPAVEQILYDLHKRFAPAHYTSGVVLSTESYLPERRSNSTTNPLADMYLFPPGSTPMHVASPIFP